MSCQKQEIWLIFFLGGGEEVANFASCASNYIAHLHTLHQIRLFKLKKNTYIQSGMQWVSDLSKRSLIQSQLKFVVGPYWAPKEFIKLWDSCDSLHPCTQCLHTHINMHAYKHTYIHNCNQSWEIQRWKASAHQSQFRQRSSNFYEPIGSYLSKLVMFQNQLPTLYLKLFSNKTPLGDFDQTHYCSWFC